MIQEEYFRVSFVYDVTIDTFVYILGHRCLVYGDITSVT